MASNSITHFHDSGAFRFNAAMSSEQTHQRWELLKESYENFWSNCNQCVGRASSGPRSTLNYPSRNESSPQSKIDARSRCTVGGTEESNARSVRKERPEFGEIGRTWQGTSFV